MSIKTNVIINYLGYVIDKMRIGELAYKAGVTPRTIRYYESLGLIGPSERQGRGFRYYTQVELAQLQNINALKGLGLSLEEVRSVIELYLNDTMVLHGKQKVLAILYSHLRETEEKIEALQQFRSKLQNNIAKMQKFIEQTQS